ncbi:MAG: DUF5682 family protein, partial [Deferribacteraceae bacterium]|nr:DUF5682 family protein [Deferribacteraceae bacterium]
AEYQPDAILIEGPADTNHLLAHIADEANRAPICIYYAYTNEEQERTSCYFPMLDYSPELAALRHGFANGIHTAFIDLPYSILADKGLDDDEKLNASYNNDYFMARSRYIEALCKKQNCRNYAELWESMFELNGIGMSTEEFVRNMLAFCYFSRLDYPEDVLKDEGCLEREAYMAVEIRKAMQNHKKVLVITGGFHTGALLKLIYSKDKPAKPASMPVSESYLIPYSYEESDSLMGYASGMPYPAFYQRVHSNITDSTLDTAFDEAVMHYLILTGQALRAKGINISISEETAAFVQGRGLADLRGKRQAGVYELLDGITSAYIKSELNVVSSELMRTCKTVLRGTQTGSVTDKADIVPLLKDFWATVKHYGLKTGTVKQELALDILSNTRHRQMSIFLRRLEFLGVGFAEMVTGPDYRAQDTSRVRERWLYAHNAKVNARIIDVSYLGGSVQEATSNLINKQQDAGSQSCAAYATLLVDVIVMDLPSFVAPLLEQVRTAITEDGAFDSLVQAASKLMFIEQIAWMLNSKLDSLDILTLIYAKAASMLPYITAKDENDDKQLAKLTKSLYQVAMLDIIDGSIFDEALLELVSKDNVSPYLYGTACGLLYSRELLTVEAVLQHTNAYLAGTGDMVIKAGLFLGGLFYTAWDIIFHHDDFVSGLSNMLQSLDQEAFMGMLPDLRLAFSTFTPSSINRIAEMVSQSLGDVATITYDVVPEPLLQQGIALDSFIADKLSARGLL